MLNARPAQASLAPLGSQATDHSWAQLHATEGNFGAQAAISWR